ncbi:MAG: hypothetical protein V2A71_07050 [Candidatus Eisenbacteria bacterium]
MAICARMILLGPIGYVEAEGWLARAEKKNGGDPLYRRGLDSLRATLDARRGEGG